MVNGSPCTVYRRHAIQNVPYTRLYSAVSVQLCKLTTCAKISTPSTTQHNPYSLTALPHPCVLPGNTNWFWWRVTLMSNFVSQGLTLNQLLSAHCWPCSGPLGSSAAIKLLETKWVREADRQSPSLKSPLSSQSNVIQEWSTVSVTWQQSPWPKATSYCVSFKVTFVGKVLELTECKPPVTYPSPSQCFLDIYCVKMMSKKYWSSAQS